MGCLKITIRNSKNILAKRYELTKGGLMLCNLRIIEFIKKVLVIFIHICHPILLFIGFLPYYYVRTLFLPISVK